MEHLLACRWDPLVPPRMVPRRLSAGQIVLNHIKNGIFSPLCCGTCRTPTSTCFCSFREGVFSTRCSCFTSPVPYFLVCRQMYAVAQSVFFSKNRFSLIGDEPQRMMRVVHTLSDNSLSMIRHLTFGLWSWQYGFDIPLPPTFDNTSRLGWSNLLHRHLCLQSVSVNFVDLGCHRADDSVAWRRFILEVIRLFGFLRGVVYLENDRWYEAMVETSIMGSHRSISIRKISSSVISFTSSPWKGFVAPIPVLKIRFRAEQTP